MIVPIGTVINVVTVLAGTLIGCTPEIGFRAVRASPWCR